MCPTRTNTRALPDIKYIKLLPACEANSKALASHLSLLELSCPLRTLHLIIKSAAFYIIWSPLHVILLRIGRGNTLLKVKPKNTYYVKVKSNLGSSRESPSEITVSTFSLSLSFFLL
jgi:hypothetical protein